MTTLQLPSLQVGKAGLPPAPAPEVVDTSLQSPLRRLIYNSAL